MTWRGEDLAGHESLTSDKMKHSNCLRLTLLLEELLKTCVPARSVEQHGDVKLRFCKAGRLKTLDPHVSFCLNARVYTVRTNQRIISAKGDFRFIFIF